MEEMTRISLDNTIELKSCLAALRMKLSLLDEEWYKNVHYLDESEALIVGINRGGLLSQILWTYKEILKHENK